MASRGAKIAIAVVAGLLTGGLAFIALGAIGLGGIAVIGAGLAFSVTTALIMGQGAENENSQTPRGPEEINVNTATEARPLPVVFGRVRLAGNIVRYDKSTFRSTEVRSEPQGGGKGGGGGGDTQVIGYEYFLSWDLAFCTGPVDKITGFYTSPGEKDMLRADPDSDGAAGQNPINFSAAVDRVSINISDGDAFKGNTRFYSGSPTQSRFPSDHYNQAEENHRHVCFAHFRGFNMGGSPAPRTTIVEVSRMPKPMDKNGVQLTDFPTRGSADVSNPSYLDANPAAAMYEILTNDLWGANIPASMLDEESFRVAAKYFESVNLGLSFSLSNQDRMSEAVNFIREHVQTIIVWTGEKVRLICLMDRANAYNPINRVTRDQVSEPVYSRPSWPSTINELRLNFVNRDKAHKTHSVVVQDMGSIAAIGRIQSSKINLFGYGSREVATRQAKRFLLEAAYPIASLSFKMNRLHAGIEPGAFLQFEWPDWTDGNATTFWRVGSIRDDQTESGMLEVYLTEDNYAVAYEGEIQAFSTPQAAFEDGEVLTDKEVSLGDDQSTEITGSFGPGATFEPAGVVTNGERQSFVMVQRTSGLIGYMAWNWKIEGAGNSTNLTSTSPWSFFGTLKTVVPKTSKLTRRLNLFVLLENPTDITEILNSASIIDVAVDDFSLLTASNQSLLMIGNEIMRIGWATDEGSSHVSFRNIIRGEYGTPVEEHSIGDQIVFIPVLDEKLEFDSGGIPASRNIEFVADQVTTRGSIVQDTQITFFGPKEKQFAGASTRPPAPEPMAPATNNGGNWQAKLRVRTFGSKAVGAGQAATIEEELQALLTQLPAGYSLAVKGYNGAAAVVGAAYTLSGSFQTAPADMPATLGITKFDFVADTGEPDTGFMKIEATPIGGVNTFRVWTVQDSVLSLDYILINP